VEKRAPYLEKCSSPAQGQSEAKPITYEPPPS
jgi:hypothetical protein